VDLFTPLKALGVCVSIGLKLCICKTTMPKLSVQLYVHEQHSVQTRHSTLNNQFCLPVLMLTNFVFPLKYLLIFCYILYIILHYVYFTDQVRV